MTENTQALRRAPKARARREEVLDEASRLLNAHGVSQSTLQDLAGELGVTRNALYYYFVDLEDLIFQTYERSCELLAARLAAAFDEGGGRLDVVKSFISRCLDPAQPQLAALNEYGLLSDAHHAVVLRRYDDTVAKLAGLLEERARSGELRPCHAQTVARTIISLVHWIPLPSAWTATSAEDRPRVVKALLDLIANGGAADRDQACDPAPVDLSPLLVRASDGFDQDAIAKVKRETILNMASRMFTCRGVDSTSLDEIATTLGTTKARLYKYVGDKQTLVAECFARADRIYGYIMTCALEQGATAQEQIVGLLRSNAMAQQHKELQPLRYGSAVGALPASEQVRAAERLRRRNQEYTALYRAAKHERSMRDIDLELFKQITPGAAAWLWKDFAKQTHDDFALVAAETTDVLRLGLRAI